MLVLAEHGRSLHKGSSGTPVAVLGTGAAGDTIDTDTSTAAVGTASHGCWELRLDGFDI